MTKIIIFEMIVEKYFRLFAKGLMTALLLVAVSSCKTGGDSSHRLDFDLTVWNFGGVDSQGGSVFHTFRITNNSEEEFVIGSLSTNCSCVHPYIGKVKIKAGESVGMEVSINPSGSYGEREYFVILHDRNENPVQRFSLKMEVF